MIDLIERLAEVLPPKPLGENPPAFMVTPVHAAEIHNRFARLTDALEAARVDGERYRWLRREVFHGDIPVGEARLILEVTGSCPSRAELDAAIDQARAADGGG